MSKLAHSNQETMDEIDWKRAIADGNEDLIPIDQVWSAYKAAKAEAEKWRAGLRDLEGKR